MARENSSSCIICSIPLFYERPVRNNIDGDDNDDEVEDRRNMRNENINVHCSCLAIAATYAAADRRKELLMKLDNEPLRYGLFPLLATITDAASDPNKISKDLAGRLVRKVNHFFWDPKLSPELCDLIALNLTDTQLESDTDIPTKWCIWTHDQGRIRTVLRNVETLLAWNVTQFWGSRMSKISNLPKVASLVLCDELRHYSANALVVQDIATVLVKGPPRQITLHFNIALDQNYLSGFTVNGMAVGGILPAKSGSHHFRLFTVISSFSLLGFNSGFSPLLSLRKEERIRAGSFGFSENNKAVTLCNES